MSKTRLTADICVIGAGSGGLSVAAAAAAFGVPVVLIEQGKMGGDCLNTGCVPSKALIAAAKHVKCIADAPRFGITAGPPEIDFAAVHAHVHRVIESIAPTDSAARFAGLGVRVLKGHGRFVDAETVTVDDDVSVKARRFVIATGSAPVIPPIPGLAAAPHLTNETIFDLSECPQHVLVIGGGAIGLELAQAFCRLGAAITVVEAATPLGRSDPEAVETVLAALRREGVVIRAGETVKAVQPSAAPGGDLALVIDTAQGEERIAGSHVLIAVGRSPNVRDLGLEQAGIAVSPQGVRVDRGLRTTNRRVYAIGDAAGGQFTHVANYHAGLVIRNALFRLPVRVDEDALPAVTFTDPELAQVGLTESEAKRRGLPINVLRWPYLENDRARAEGQTKGHIKLVTTKRGRLLGATIVGSHAGELLATYSLAVGRKLSVSALAGMTVAYPTMAEIGKRAAISFYGSSLTNAAVRRMIAWLRCLG